MVLVDNNFTAKSPTCLFHFGEGIVLNNRFWAMLLAIIISMPVSINLGEIWGISQDPLPRFTYQTLLPFILSLALLWKDLPKRWPWLMAACGLMIFVHPVSAPIFGFAIWTGLWLSYPSQWPFKKRILVMVGLGLIFIIAALPFAFNYFFYHVQGGSQDYTKVMSVLIGYFPDNLFNIPSAILDFINILIKDGLLPLSILGFIALLLLRPQNNTFLSLILIWGAGLVFMVILVPFIEQTIERYLQLLPLETELLRGIRYMIPLLLILCIWPLSELHQRLKNKAAAKAITAVGLIFAGLWIYSHQPNFGEIGQTIDCLSQGKMICVTNEAETNFINRIMTYVPIGDPIFVYTSNGPSHTFALEIRYAAMRPLVYSYKDSGLLGYSNQLDLLNWLTTTKTLELIKENYIRTDRIELLVILARKLHAQYLLVDFNVNQPKIENLKLTTVYRDSKSTLIDLDPAKPSQ